MAWIPSRPENATALRPAPLVTDRRLMLATAGLLVLLLVVACLVDLVWTGRIDAYNQKRILEIILLSWLLLTVAVRPAVAAGMAQYLDGFPVRVRWALGAVVLLGLASAITAAHPRAAAAEFALLTSLGLGVLVIAHTRAALGPRFERWLVMALMIGAGLYAVRFLGGYAAALTSEMDFDYRNLFAGFDNRRFLNQFQAWTLPLLLLPVLWFARKRRRAAAAGALSIAALWWMILMASNGRGVFIAVLGGALLAALALGARSAVFLRLFAASAVLGAVLYFFLFHVLLPPDVLFQDRLADLESQARLVLWSRAWEYAAGSPLLGIGPAHYAWLSPDIARHPHNAPLQLAAEWGWIAATLVTAMAVAGLAAWIMQARRCVDDPVENTMDAALTASAGGAAGYALLSGVIVMPLSQVMGMVVLGWMLARCAGFRTNLVGEPARVGPATRWTVSMVAGVLLILLWVGTGPEIVTLLTDPAAASAMENLPGQPRIWRQGRLGFDA